MKSFPLHIKTAILAATISIVVLLAGLIVSRANIARQIQEEQKQLAVLQAENLAGQLSKAQNPFDVGTLEQLTNVASGSRPNLIGVRLWKLENEKFTEAGSSNGKLPVGELSDELQYSLRNGISSTSMKLQQNDADDSSFRVFSLILEDRQITGALEAVERLDSTWAITMRYGENLVLSMFAAVALMSVALYFFIRRLVYKPIGKLLSAMERARAGDLSVELKQIESPDEFGSLSNNFNSMMSQIREMTAEREKQTESLQQRIGFAVTELTQKNEQLETANLELFRTARIMSELERLAAAGQTAAQFAHEVGTPLNLISGHTQLLQSVLPKESKDGKRLQIIADQIERIEKIVREMLDRTRFGKAEATPLDVNNLLRKQFAVMEPTLENRDVVLSADLATGLPQISGDADSLQQVFLNLFNNALDALPDGGELTISTSTENKRVIVEFADSGTGMTEDVRANIFQPLFTTKERGRGTGLGLFVVKQILQEHGAEISVRSKLDVGTTFKLSFPGL